MLSKNLKLTSVLFIIIFLEGYIVLASEILAIRQITSYVGNGADTVSIIIAAVLMPLAFGYYAGGNFRPAFDRKGKWISIRAKLISNIILAAWFLLPALATIAIDLFFNSLFAAGISDRILLTSFYSVIFLVVPVFLLGQTVPLVSNFFSAEKLPLVTAKILFISTAGSFIGSVITTIVIMRFFGANNAVNMIFVLLAILVLLLSKKMLSDKVMTILFLAGVMLYCNSNAMLRHFGIIYNNAYNTATVIETETGRMLSLNGSASSFIGQKGEKFPYVEYIEKHYIKPISTQGMQPPKKILIIGAAGFTMGSEDEYNDYIYVDIDPDIKETAEHDFLKHKLGGNKRFAGQDIISYLATNRVKYDMIVIDAYTSKVYIPEQLVTKDFLTKIKESLLPKGIVVANFIVSPNFSDAFSKRIDNTFRSVFHHAGRQVVDDDFNGWSDDDFGMKNIIYSYRHDMADDDTVYTSNNNTAAFDKPNMRYKQ